MNTWRVCAAIGLGLTCAIASGCSSDSDKKNDGGGGRDTGSGRDQSIGRDTISGESCEYRGQTYQQGETFTYNCVRFRCEGGNDIVQISGSPCTDGGAGHASGQRRAGRSRSRRADAADAGRDVAPVETGRQDVRPPVDAQAIDVEPRADTASREDTAAATDRYGRRPQRTPRRPRWMLRPRTWSRPRSAPTTARNTASA